MWKCLPNNPEVDVLLRIALIGGFIIMAASILLANGKNAPTYYTPERVAFGRENVEKQAWAQATVLRLRKGDTNNYYTGREFGSADGCIAQTDDFMWLLQPTTKIPRVPPNHETNALCPVHGEKVRAKNAWTAWTTDPIGHPYKVRCRLGGEWYPSNDFMNGDLTSGEFPDDGSGCQYQGKTYHFLKEYAHMAYGNNTIPCLRSLSQMWQLTGDKRYGRAGCILLARLATQYPNFTDRKDRLFYGPYNGRDPHYTWKTGGMITDFIWESFCLEATAYAYDGLWSYMDQDPELIAFLKTKGMPIADGNGLRRYIEENILRVGMQALQNGFIEGNEGFYQAAAMACALVMDDYGDVHPNSKDMVDFAFLGKGRAAYAITNTTNRDGSGHESPGYNSIKFDFIRVNRLMEAVRERHPELYPVEKYPDLFGGLKGQALFEHFIDLSVLSSNLPSIGDACAIAAPERRKPGMISYVTKENLYGFGRFASPRLARASTKTDGTMAPGELFEKYPEAELKAALQTPEAQIQYRDRLLDGYGVGIIETGPADMGHAVSINYASIPGHRQFDNLNLEMWARSLNVLPDLGYPFTWDYRHWDSGTMTHNTVTVDETEAERNIGGQANLTAFKDGVHVLSARHDPYPSVIAGANDAPASGVTRYERTTVTVDTENDRFYVVDLFAVNGGSQHDQVWHGPLTPVQLPPLKWVEQPTGTLAGPEVAHGQKYKDRWGREAPNVPCYVSKVKRASLAAPAVCHWDFGLPEGDQLNLHLVPLGGAAELISGTGRSPARPADWGLDYVYLRRPSPGEKPNYFLTVLDSFQKTPTVQSVRVASEQPLMVEVTRADGAVDEITLSTPSAPSRTTEPRGLGVRFLSRRDGAIVKQVEVGSAGTPGTPVGPGYATSTVKAVDWQKNEIALSYKAGMEQDFSPERYLRIYNWGRSAMYRILKAERRGDELLLSLDSTALLSQGPITKAVDDSLFIGDSLVFANGAADEKGQLKQGNDYFAGSYVSDGASTLQLQGAVRGNPTRLYLREGKPQAELEKSFVGKPVSIWQYGVGDQVEIARIK